ncbi:uncharacterized protein LOC108476500 [Gossypium arboreum]|uniref:uncharacterized protein LOC108476500 n=1 Tax=Gossypium arboreum TaxID=29729 RepID=UPI0008190091|nr:uncharacterized protein LOC108476500 [Gossypium arboreum]
MPHLDTSEMSVSPAIETESQSRLARDDALSQAMLRILERNTGPHSRFGGRGSVIERLRSNCAKLLRGVTEVAPSVAKFWLKDKERIMNDLDYIPEQKFKGEVSLLHDEAYRWRLTVEEGTQPDHLTWDFFKTALQSKYVEVSYVVARTGDFMNLTQGDSSVAEYEAKFLRLSRYTRVMVVFEYTRCVRFEDGLRDNLRVLIASQRQREFTVLVEKAKIAEDVKRMECHNRNRERSKNKRDAEPSSSVPRPKKKASSDGPIRVWDPVVPVGLQLCGNCGRCHPSECWRKIGACL